MYSLDYFIEKREKLDSLLAKAKSIADRPTVDSPNDPFFAVADIGSNSVRLIIFDCSSGTPQNFIQYSVKAGLARGMSDENHVLNREGMAVASAAFDDFDTILTTARIRKDHIDGFATAALRDATDEKLDVAIRQIGFAYHTVAETIFGHPIRIISGDEEAELGAEGLKRGWPTNPNTITGISADLGGGSLELTKLVRGELVAKVSIPDGALTLAAKAQNDITKADDLIHDHLKPYTWLQNSGPIFVMGGNWRAIGKLCLLDDEKKKELHGLSVKKSKVRGKIRDIISRDLKMSDKVSNIIKDREVNLPYAAVMLQALIDVVQPEDVCFSTQGIREGAVWRLLEKQKRALDLAA